MSEAVARRDPRAADGDGDGSDARPADGDGDGSDARAADGDGDGSDAEVEDDFQSPAFWDDFYADEEVYDWYSCAGLMYACARRELERVKRATCRAGVLVDVGCGTAAERRPFKRTAPACERCQSDSRGRRPHANAAKIKNRRRLAESGAGTASHLACLAPHGDIKGVDFSEAVVAANNARGEGVAYVPRGRAEVFSILRGISTSRPRRRRVLHQRKTSAD